MTAPSRPAPLFGEPLLSDLLDSLADRGWAYAPEALDAGLCAALREDAAMMDAAGETEEGRVGRGAAEARRLKVRKTRIAWLDAASPAQARFLAGAEALRLELNRRFFLGLFEFESHFAVYPPGGFYVRHLDAFRPDRGAGAAAGLGERAGRSRVVSLVAYLNPDWTPDKGGALALWERAPEGKDGRPDLAALDAIEPAAVIPPLAGGLVLMLSETIPHEVRESFADRYAIAGWFRVNASVAGALDPPR